MMLPASDLAEIVTNLVGLRLEPDTTAQILDAVLPPLLRSSQTEDLPDKPARTQRHLRPKRKKPKHRAPRAAEARERARAALAANPGASLTAVAKAAGVSRGTVVNARDDLAAEARKRPAEPSERRERAQRFLREQLGRGPKPVNNIEAAAAK